MAKQRGKTVATICACGCGKTFHPRIADVARGWGKFVNKTHKAKEQERRTGQHHRHLNRCNRAAQQMSAADLSGGGYGDTNENSPFGDGKY